MNLTHIMWTTLIDYGCNHWYEILQAYLKQPEVARPNFNDNLDLWWVANSLMCIKNKLNSSWITNGSSVGMFR